MKKFTTKNLFENGVKLWRLNSFENRGEIKESLKFNGQLRVNLHKSKTKDQNKKDAKIRS